MSDAKIILLDIETTPLIGYAWKTWETDIIRVEEDWGILCIGWKELKSKTTQVIARPDFPKEYAKDSKDDFKVCEAIHKVMSDADILIAHNGDRFDIRKIQARLLCHGFDPPTPFQTVDTLKIARRHFAFTSSKLDDLGQTLGVGAKVKHPGFDMWLGCMAGNEASWKLMTKYCRGDVELLERVYEKLLPWAVGTPNLALLNENPDACPSCGADALVRQGYKKTKTMTYQRFQCNLCGAWSRGRMSEKTVIRPMAVN